MLKKQILRIKNKIGDRLQPTIRKMCGIKDINEQIDSLYYIVNHGLNIKEFPRATGLLRQVQLADAELLRIFHEVCQKHHLTYWLDYGNLLGGVRHGGFIPWDDDMDVSMPREDFYKALEILPDELIKFDMEVFQVGWLVIDIWNGGVHLDIFPVDNVSRNEIKDADDFKGKAKKYIAFRKTIREPNERTDKERAEIIGHPSQDAPILYCQLERMPSICMMNYDMIFPLTEIQFEGYTFNAPHRIHDYLELVYGDYMSFPRKGILHHVEDELPIYRNSEQFGTNMDELINKLKSIHP